MSGFIFGNVAEWLFAEQKGKVQALGISLKTNLFITLITDTSENCIGNWSKKKQ